jgi:antirestriction protein ArdC
MYRGINILTLWAIARKEDYRSHEWATPNQWRERRYPVKRKERPTEIIYANYLESPEDPHVRTWGILNGEQVKGWKPRTPNALPEADRIGNAERFFAELDADVRTQDRGHLRAYYSPRCDFINMPPFEAFIDAVSYYSTLGHEHVHWTGAKNRCKRSLYSEYGSAAYAFEELIAELGAAFLCARLNIENPPRRDHAAYVSDWLKVLKNDSKSIFKGASKAQKAVDWMFQKGDGKK